MKTHTTNNDIVLENAVTFGAVNNTTLMSNDIDQIATALSAAQSELETANKGESGYGYNYSDLATVIKTAKPVLAKHGLAVTQLLSNQGDKPAVETILIHKSGQYFKSYASLPLIEMKGCNEAQRAGAVYSYLRRYAFQAILGMSSEDNDAHSDGPKKTSFSKSVSKKTNTVASKPSGQKFRKKKSVNTVDDDEI